MTASIIRVDGPEAYDLIFPEHLSMLTSIEQETMQRALRNSTLVWLGMSDEKILALWGLIPPTLLSDTAYLWMFHTKHLDEHKFVFIRHSQRVIERMLQQFPSIVGHVAITNRRAQQWLRWLGAEFGDPINNVAFPFTIKAKASQWQQDSVQSA